MHLNASAQRFYKKGTLSAASTTRQKSVSCLQHRLIRYNNDFPRAKLAIAVRSTAVHSASAIEARMGCAQSHATQALERQRAIAPRIQRTEASMDADRSSYTAALSCHPYIALIIKAFEVYEAIS